MKYWVLTANFAEGLPYAVITMLSVVMLADMGVGKAEVTAWTSLLALPWSFKALWSPLIGMSGSRWTLRRWVWVLQVVLAACLGGVAVALMTDSWLMLTLVAMGVGAFASATYDIACDGFYMQELDEQQQAFHVGIRTTAYRLSMIFASGAITALVGILARNNGNDLRAAWMWVMAGLAVVMMGFAVVHRCILPGSSSISSSRNIESSNPSNPSNLSNLSNPSTPSTSSSLATEWGKAFRDFLLKPGLLSILLFLLFFRLGEALLSKMTILFLKAPVAEGGLGLDNAEYGMIYGTVGVGALIVGGILGGMLLSRYGLKRCLIPYALLLNVPDLLYVWMSVSQPDNRWLIGSLVGIEQFGYGLGFTAYTVYLLRAAQGKYATAHYAILTALMALGMNIPSMLSGMMQEHLGYTAFFWVAVACTIPGILLSLHLTLKNNSTLTTES